MWIVKGNRENLLDLIDRKKTSDFIAINSYQDINKYINRYDNVFYWENDPFNKNIPLPDAVICGNELRYRDFLAWVSTYVSQFRPFTAFSRVIEVQHLLKYLKVNKNYFDTHSINNSFTGIIISELISNKYSYSQITPQLAKSTYSYVFAQVYLDRNFTFLDQDISSAIRRLEVLFPYRKNRLDNDLVLIWNMISMILFGNNLYSTRSIMNIDLRIYNLIFEATYDIRETGKIANSIWKLLIKEIPLLSTVDDEFELSTREFKVAVFEKLIRDLIYNRAYDKTLISFVASYLISKIAPGSLKYLDLLIPYQNQLPSLLLWYGFMSGLNLSAQINNYGDSLGWRILRDIETNKKLLSLPSCDISLDELEVLSISNPNVIKNIRKDNDEYINIELFPSIEIYVNAKTNDSINSEIKSSIDEYDKSDLLNLTKKLTEALNLIQIMKKKDSKRDVKKNLRN